MSKAFPIIAGTADISSQENLLFGNLKHLTDGSITKAKPDCYGGSRPGDLNKQIREELGPYIVPSLTWIRVKRSPFSAYSDAVLSAFCTRVPCPYRLNG